MSHEQPIAKTTDKSAHGDRRPAFEPDGRGRGSNQPRQRKSADATAAKHFASRAVRAHSVRFKSFCKRTVLEIEAPSLNAVFGSPDDMKFRSCATLFALASGERDNPFQRALDRWCDGGAGVGLESKRTIVPDFCRR